MITGVRNVFILFPFLWGCASAYQASDMQLGFYRYSGSITVQQRDLIWDLEDAALSKGASEFRSIQAVVDMGESSTWGVLSDKLNLGIINLASSTVVGPWPLTRWEGELSSGISEIYEIPGGGAKLLYPELLDEQYTYGFHPGGFETSLGCYMETPLRYGEVLSLPERELVIFLGRPAHRDVTGLRTLDMVVFSPSKGQIVFSMRAARENQGPSPGDDDYYPMPLPSRPQFITSVYHDSAAPGTRSYAKMYIDDFNGDEREDIIVWRKRYVSNNIENPVIGFHLDKQVFNHYGLVDGQYILQDTPEATIRSWLATSNLTWQKGFPSHSECPGQEGQLIPEMHDPLLNDPDVLQ
ncbi:MAG: hypothetical protein V2I38_13895 [Alcanivoracaceae bacterium]|jgi:hypothetical protein|nr:hypothetical protein [Alcanivoracaceae bacterium]